MRKTSLVLVLLAAACGGKAETPWESETIVFHEPDGTRTEALIGDDCAELNDEVCVDASEECGDRGAADVYLDDEGNVLEVICFAPPGEEVGEVITVAEGEEITPENNDVLVLEGDAETPAIVGDVDLDSNNVTLWGEDPETSVLDGNLDVSKNNALVNGITITGDVHVTFNNASFANCVIVGDVILDGNNAKIAGCRIEGTVTVNGNNNEFTATTFANEFSDEGQNTICNETSREVEGEVEPFECGSEPDPEEPAEEEAP